MGAWGHRTFENDDALDWLAEVAGSEELSAIEAALAAVVGDGDSYPEAPECCNALAAAELLAALNGKPSSSLPEEALSWLEGKPKPKSSLVEKARQAVSVISKSSELQELWAESDEADQWQADVSQLQARLS